MYFDHRYIEMCRKNTWLNRDYVPKCGDTICGKIDTRPMVVTSSNKAIPDTTFVFVMFLDAFIPTCYMKKNGTYFPLFSQYQLQEILNRIPLYTGTWGMLQGFHHWYLERPMHKDKPLEILWLLFAMEKRVNKTWDGEQWQKLS